MAFPDNYMKLYNASAHAVKSVDSKFKVGGPATMQLLHAADFVRLASASKIPFDFVSTHMYPTDPQCGGHSQKGTWNPRCLTEHVTAVRKTVAEHPFYLTEYNVGCCLGYSQHDTSGAAAFAFQQVGDMSGVVDIMSWWTFTDVFEEGGFPGAPGKNAGAGEFSNIYGLMTVHGIPKPGWRAFQLMNGAGDYKLNTTVGNGTEQEEQQEQSQCSLVEGVDFMGGDMLPNNLRHTTPTAAACCEACQKKVGCQAWGWGHTDHPRLALRCYLKKLSLSPRTEKDTKMTSGYPGKAPPPPPPPPCPVEDATNLAGFTLSTVKADTAQLCCDACKSVR